MSEDPRIRECENHVLRALQDWEKKNKAKVTAYVFEVFEIEDRSMEETQA